MNAPPDAALEARLRDATRFARLVHVAACPSTQDLAAAESGSLCVWADAQTAGRGRRGRVWAGEPGVDVEMTLRVEGFAIPRPELLAPAIPCGVLIALESLCGERLTMKWPNDVHHHGRKLCGILIDVHGGRDRTLLVGVGVNVNRTRFPSELVETATSLATIAGRRIDRDDVVLRVACAVDRIVTDLTDGRVDRIAPVFRSRTGLVGARVELQVVGDGTLTGTVAALDLESVSFDDGTVVRLVRVEGLRRS